MDGLPDDGPVLPLFVFDEDVLEHAAPPRVRFLLDALASLRAWYRARGSDLYIARGDPATVIPDLAAAQDAEAVTWGRDYSGLATERDTRVTQALDSAGVDARPVTDTVLHEPGSITTTKGDHYSVYSYYWKKWQTQAAPDPVGKPSKEDLASVDGEPLPTPETLGFDTPAVPIPEATHTAARNLLSSFCAGPIYEYEAGRDDPAAEAASGLSPHLKFGTVGIRSVYTETEQARAAASDDTAESSVETFQSQLAWREFYMQVLADRPDTVRQNFKHPDSAIPWRNDPDELAAWKAGETGYPFVDAGMRQLAQEGIMHNRLRMVVASFLTKDLLTDWRYGYDWFKTSLIDHETANDVGGWQWAASTGTDAQPYFRVFNPTTQGERCDPDAQYIKDYVPELATVSAERIHSWPDLSGAKREELAPGYPDPIVDHATRREAAIEMFEHARE
jgi:deoxyribodipyrimidine photo-lyase